MLFSVGSCSFNAESDVISISFFNQFHNTHTFSFLDETVLCNSIMSCTACIYYLVCHIESLMKCSGECKAEPSSTDIV